MFAPRGMVGLPVSHSQSRPVTRPSHTHHLESIRRLRRFITWLCAPVIHVIIGGVALLQLTQRLLCGFIRLCEIVVSCQSLSPHVYLTALFLPQHLVIVESLRRKVHLQHLTKLRVDLLQPLAERLFVTLGRLSCLFLALVVLIRVVQQLLRLDLHVLTLVVRVRLRVHVVNLRRQHLRVLMLAFTLCLLTRV